MIAVEPRTATVETPAIPIGAVERLRKSRPVSRAGELLRFFGSKRTSSDECGHGANLGSGEGYALQGRAP